MLAMWWWNRDVLISICWIAAHEEARSHISRGAITQRFNTMIHMSEHHHRSILTFEIWFHLVRRLFLLTHALSARLIITAMPGLRTNSHQQQTMPTTTSSGQHITSHQMAAAAELARYSLAALQDKNPAQAAKHLEEALAAMGR